MKLKLRIPDDLYEKLYDVSELNDITVQDLINKLITEALNQRAGDCRYQSSILNNNTRA